MRMEPLQKLAEALGENGCYFFSVLYRAEKLTGVHLNSLDVYLLMLSKNIIGKDCFMNDAGAMLSLLTNMRWLVSIKDKDYSTKAGELEILYFENTINGKLYGHFVVGDGFGRVEYDPYGDSNTVKYGKLIGKRILQRV
jgi:hypothetical protein